MTKNTGIALLAVAVVGALFYYFGFMGTTPASPALGLPAEAVSVDPATVETGILGLWQSTDDPNFTREFRADGTVVDRYAGDASAESAGAWTVYAPGAAPEDAAFIPDQDSAYLRITAEGLSFDFLVVGLSESGLVMIYLDRGNVLSFTRIR